MSPYVYAVITEVPNPDEHSGNLCSPMLYWKIPEGAAFPDEMKLIAVVYGRIEVFIRGEVLVLDGHMGREVSGKGRKPSKWAVEVEHFDDIEDAIKKAKEVTRW